MATRIKPSRHGSGRATGLYLLGTRSIGLSPQRQDQLVRKVRSGFPFNQLIRLEKATGLTRERIAEFVSITPRTLVRRQHEGKLKPDESDRVLRASRVFELAVELFENDTDRARQWLLTPNTALAGDCPLDFASTDVGAREVENLIGRLTHGVFS